MAQEVWLGGQLKKCDSPLRWMRVLLLPPQDSLTRWPPCCCTPAWPPAWPPRGACALWPWRCPISWPRCSTAAQRGSTTWRVRPRPSAATALPWPLCWVACTSVRWASPTPRARSVCIASISNKQQPHWMLLPSPPNSASVYKCWNSLRVSSWW